MNPRTSRTKAIIDRMRGGPNEYSRLHAILCMDHGWSGEDSRKLAELVDLIMIAERMDELTAEHRARAEQEK